MNTRMLDRWLIVGLFTFLLPLETRAAAGDLYVSDAGSGTILKFIPAGTSSIFASGLTTPRGLAFDRAGNLYVVEQDIGTILKFAPDGSQTTFASGLSLPSGLAFDGAGNLYVTESFGDIGEILKFTPAGVKSTFADGQNLVALAFDLSGNLFASTIGPTNLNGEIVKYTPNGNGSSFALSAGPGMAFSTSGHLFATDRSGFSTIAEFSPTGGRSAFTSAVQTSNGLAFDGAGNLFGANTDSGEIFQFTPAAAKSTFTSGLNQPVFLAFEPLAEKLRNLSARGLVGTADEVLISGFIVGRSAVANNSVVARAIGPSLSEAEVSNPLQDPELELHNASGALIASNDDWQETQKAQISASGLAPTNDREAAIFATLPAGNYTAVVRGAGNTTGVALVEVYSVSQ